MCVLWLTLWDVKCAQMQGDWVIGLINRMREAGERKVLAEESYEEEWRQTILKLADMTLVPGTKSVCYAPAISSWTWPI